MFNKLKRRFEADKILKFFIMLAAMAFLNNVGQCGEPFAAALYFAVLANGGGIFVCGLCYGLASVTTLSPRLIVAAIAAIFVLSVIYGTFGKKHNMGIASLVFLPAALVPYIFIDGEEFYLSRLVCLGLVTALGGAFYPFVRALKIKGFQKPEPHEILSLAALYVCIWLGGIKYTGLDGYKAICILAITFISAVFSGGESCLFSFVFAVPACVYGKDATLFAPFLLIGAVSFVFAKHNRLVYVAMLIAAELTSAYVFRWYGQYSYVSLIYFSVPLLIFAAVPEKLTKSLGERLSFQSEKVLSRYEINRTRTLVSGQLYEISGTFREISDLFSTLSQVENPFLYEDAIKEEIVELCDGCSYCAKCRAASFPKREDVLRLITIAKGKGRLTAVDLPKSFSNTCRQSGKVIFIINKYIAVYGAEMEKKRAAEETRALVSLQADGVASALKGIAKTLSKTLSYKPKKERKLYAFLLKKGVNVREVMLFGEGEDTEIRLTLSANSPEEKTVPAINEFFRLKFAVTEKYDLPNNRTAVTLEPACKYDCIFGVSAMRKSGESACGDTHSLIKLGRNKFMLALSDGMGSGETARVTSQASLSLIECFYRAGLPGDTALSTVNGLLSFAGADNFAALDLAVINLETLVCDFIKLGAPYGFILSGGSVKLIEGSSLPMGILNQLKPSVCSEPISPGDVILFMSDGITDAFGSATDFSDFLAAASASNPQKLADKIVQEAFSLYGNTASDDMTVVACKIFAV